MQAVFPEEEQEKSEIAESAMVMVRNARIKSVCMEKGL